MGSSSIDLSLAQVWKCWFKFRKGKRRSQELEVFSYYLEENLRKLQTDLENGHYTHGGYKTFIVTDNKRREISVASVRDRVVHRILYEYLVPIYDKTFIYDAWSCRKDKGLLGAIERTQKFLTSYPDSVVWRADIVKFFDNVDREVLFSLLQRRIKDEKTLTILKTVITSYAQERESKSSAAARVGIPIGNLTSQIFANIYLNELDRFMVHALKPAAYLRYGDDFIVLSKNKPELTEIRSRVQRFLRDALRLEINSKNDIIVKTSCRGLHFLGCHIFPKGRHLNKRNRIRANNKVNLKNISSYSGLVRRHEKQKYIKEFDWSILEKFDQL